MPELQRDYVWRPTQVAKLVDSLYRGFPIGSLLFWQAEATAPVTRDMQIGGQPSAPFRQPIYLLDGQQRLTSLHRVFHDHPDAQIVFHLEKERFQNQSAVTKADHNWIKVADILDPAIAIGTITRRLRRAGCALPEAQMEQRLASVRSLRDRTFNVETLRGFEYDDIAEIFVRVNSAGRHLTRADLAMSTLSARWPGVVKKFQQEANHWRRAGYAEVDTEFLARAFAGVLFGGGLSSWSVTDIDRVGEEKLAEAWDTVRRGLRHLVALLTANLKLSTSLLLPSLLPFIPLVVLLGEREDRPLDEEAANAIIYWFLVATIRTRYSSSTDTNLAKDISAARGVDPTRELLHNLGVLQALPEITPESLAGRTKESPYFFLSLLAAQRNGAKDWWYGTAIVPGPTDERQLEFHHVHPIATLVDYDKGEINELANLAFISQEANRRISDKSPVEYFATLTDTALAGHYIPLDPALRPAGAFREFLAERRRLLATAMNTLLAGFRPGWLDQVPAGPAAPTDGYTLTMVLYGSAWLPGELVFRSGGVGVSWTGSADMEELSQAITTAALTGIEGDVEISGESVPVHIVDESVVVPIGPFLVSGTAEEWEEVFERERAGMQRPDPKTRVTSKPWTGDRIPLPVTSTD